MTAFREAFPILYVDDVESAAAFYTSTFGFEQVYRHEDEFAAAEGLRAAGATEVRPPTDQPWGERMCAFVDPNGHLIHVGAKA